MCFANWATYLKSSEYLTVDLNLVEVFAKYMDKDTVVLLAARAARMENQDSIDTVNMLADPKEVNRMRDVQTSEKFTSCHSTLLTSELLSLALIQMENATDPAPEQEFRFQIYRAGASSMQPYLNTRIGDQCIHSIVFIPIGVASLLASGMLCPDNNYTTQCTILYLLILFCIYNEFRHFNQFAEIVDRYDDASLPDSAKDDPGYIWRHRLCYAAIWCIYC